ncbi:MAG: diversity-generating retroelement protein Avd [Chloroflexi bacterium]|nr:diversity-generating retroelement protein Avd [Chloroflexota bacterium]
MLQPTGNTPKAVEDCHQLLLWLLPKLDQFPRKRQFTIAHRLHNRFLDILECLIEASYKKQKRQILQTANLHLEIARHLWRLCFEEKLINLKSYEYGVKLMLELGKQIGGWIRSQTAKA